MPVTSQDDDLRDQAETAVKLRCSIRTVQRLKAEGLLGSVTIRGRVYFPDSEIEAYIKRKTTPGKDRAKPKKAS